MKNKICAVIMVAIGTVPVFLEGDGTCLVLFLLLGIPLFFSKENMIG